LPSTPTNLRSVIAVVDCTNAAPSPSAGIEVDGRSGSGPRGCRHRRW
jgi:hypothetical protein